MARWRDGEKAVSKEIPRAGKTRMDSQMVDGMENLSGCLMVVLMDGETVDSKDALKALQMAGWTPMDSQKVDRMEYLMVRVMVVWMDG